jgi:hypothetical protein
MSMKSAVESRASVGLPIELRQDLLRVALRDRWDRLFFALGWLHLAFSGFSQWLFLRPWHEDWQYIVLWLVEVVGVLVVLRVFAGRLWFTRTPLAAVLMRIWATFFLVAFGSATLNSSTGFAVNWFKVSWASLSTFGWATTAALLGWRFLIPAFLMYFTGLLMARQTDYSYLIFGTAWFIALHGLGAWLVWKRRVAAKPA